jgi:hypothetical protein
MLVVLAGAHLALKLAPKLVEKLVNTGAAVTWRHGAHAAVRVHRHGDKSAWIGDKARINS